MKQMGKKKLHRGILVLIVTGMILPPVALGVFFMGVPSISPEKAREILADSPDEAVLIDVRPKREYEKFHLVQAVNIPMEDLSMKSMLPLTAGDEKHLFVICNAGVLSARAVDVLHRLGFTRAKNVRNGMDFWLNSGKRGARIESTRAMTPMGETEAVPRIHSTIFEQFVICAAAFFLKPLYELISLILILWLRKSEAPDLAALRRSMIAFFIGENACAVNFLFFNEQSHLLEFFHTYGMLVCFGFAGHALLTAVDIRLIRFSEKKDKCTLLPLCGRCYKHQDVSCNLRVLALPGILAAIVISFMPLTAELGSYFYVTRIFGDEVVFGHSLFQQVFEVRLYPMAALLFFVLSFVVLLTRKEEGVAVSKILFAIGLGPLSFSLMRFLCFWGYSRNPLWAEAWEEITEFLFIGLALCILLQVRKATARVDQGRRRRWS